MYDAYGNPMPENVYYKNETMRFLGKQTIDCLCSNDKVREQIMQISEARPSAITYEAATDVFLLGYIYGKRAERAKRKRTN